jgi:hypothetical protein
MASYDEMSLQHKQKIITFLQGAALYIYKLYLKSWEFFTCSTVGHESSLPVVGHESSLLVVGHESSLPVVGHESSLLVVGHGSSLPVVGYESSLPVVQ